MPLVRTARRRLVRRPWEVRVSIGCRRDPPTSTTARGGAARGCGGPAVARWLWGGPAPCCAVGARLRGAASWSEPTRGNSRPTDTLVTQFGQQGA
eukprot:scaffold21360_cov65-Phaeocystis_antarctica.AAC.2